MQLSKEQVEQIPALIVDGQTQMDVAIYFGVSRNCINRWVRILKQRGVKLAIKTGRPSIFRKEPPCKTPQA